MGIYVKFTKTTHQIWSCHVTLASNSGNFYFSPNSVLNCRKSYQIWGKLAQEQKSYRQKTNWEVENTLPPVFNDKFCFSTDGVIKNVRDPYDRSIKPFFSCIVQNN